VTQGIGPSTAKKQKDIEEDYRKWNDLPYLWVGRINIVKMSILPKAICMLFVIHIKIPMTFVMEIGIGILMWIA
jgi:hypothetical protein